MAVDSIELGNKLYDAKNCYFHHFLRDKNVKTMNYGILDTAHRFIKFIGKETKDRYFKDFENYDSMFTLRLYLMKLINSQNIIVSNEKEKANFIVTLEKSTEENSISLLDNNFFPNFNFKFDNRADYNKFYFDQCGFNFDVKTGDIWFNKAKYKIDYLGKY